MYAEEGIHQLCLNCAPSLSLSSAAASVVHYDRIVMLTSNTPLGALRFSLLIHAPQIFAGMFMTFGE